MRPFVRGLGAFVALVTTLSALAGCGGSHRGATETQSQPSPTGAGETGAAPGCRTDPHFGVHDPSRLKIKSPCAEIVGKVINATELAPDGDIYFNVRPDPKYAWMMDARNRSDGGLHIEIVPMDQPGCTRGQPIVRNGYNNMGVCSGADVISPPLGARVRVTGPYVLDSWTKLNEIHPAWKVQLLPS